MKTVEFLEKGTPVFVLQMGIIEEYKVKNTSLVVSNDSDEVKITYDLINSNTGKNTTINSKLVYDDINLLKENILEQFDKLINKNEENKEEAVPEMANPSSS